MNTRRIVLVSLLACTALVAPVYGQEIRDPRAVCDEANDAYRDTRFEDAIKGYRRLLAAGYRQAEIYYNLGNAQFRAGNLGEALASYERARRLHPRDPNIRANMSLARRRTRDSMETGSLPGFVERTLFWYRAVSRTELMVLVSTAYISFWLVLVLRLKWRHKGLSRAALAIACVCGILAASGAAKYREEMPGTKGVIVSAVAAVRAGHGEEYTRLFDLHDGAEVAIEETIEGWHRIDVSKDKRGWICADNIEPI